MNGFGSSSTAVRAAAEMQRELTRRRNEHGDAVPRVRVGLNVGDVIDHDGAPLGAAINATARVMARAGGGQIFATEAVRHAAGPGTGPVGTATTSARR